MTTPFNFQINVPNALQTLQNVTTVARDQENLAHEMEQRRLEREQRESAIAANRRYQRDLMSLSDNPTTENVLKIAARYPQQMEAFEKLMGMSTEAERKSSFDQATTIDAMMKTKSYDQAKNYLEDLRQASINAGDEDQAKLYEAFQLQLEDDPGSFTATTKMILRSTKEGREYLESQLEEEKAKSEFDFKNFDKEMKKRDLQIKMEEVKLRKEDNALKREERQQKIEQLKREKEEKERARESEFRSNISSIDNMLNTVERAMKMDVGGVYDNVLGPVSSSFISPTIRQESADFEGVVELLSNQAFLAVIPTLSGLGALSDAEGRKLTNSIQSFSLKQSPDSMRKSLKETRRLMLKARENLAKKFGFDLPIPDTPFAIKTLDDINLDQQSSDEIASLLDQWMK